MISRAATASSGTPRASAASAESVPAAGERFELEVASESREALLFDYLDRLIYERDVRLVLPADHRCTVREPGEAGPADESADAGERRDQSGDGEESYRPRSGGDER